VTDTATEPMQVMPPLDEATEAALRASIEKFGVIVPVVVDQSGRVLDGHHRQRIAEELGKSVPLRTFPVASDDEAMEVAASVNLDRRQVMDVAHRRAVVVELRREGHSLRAIAGATGVSLGQTQRDLAAAGVSGDTPDAVTGRDGKQYPAQRPVEPVLPLDEEEDLVLTQLGPDADRAEARAIVDAVKAAHDGDVPVEAVAAAVAEALGSRELLTPPERPPITKPDLGGGVSHPARYSDELFQHFRELLDAHSTVLDPFAGTGRIHELRPRWETTGVELEPEWAQLSPHTIVGSALALPFPDEHFDAICTSPTYGNRLADHHDAADPGLRRSYTHDLGRTLTAGNSGVMHWGDTYRDFHEQAWREAVRVLVEGGTFILNIKDHFRKGQWQDVAGWHVHALCDLGLYVEAVRPVATGNLRQGANGDLRVPDELVIAFGKGFS
jgi:ParB-like chromosome segregation protein Spo0J